MALDFLIYAREVDSTLKCGVLEETSRHNIIIINSEYLEKMRILR